MDNSKRVVNLSLKAFSDNASVTHIPFLIDCYECGILARVNVEASVEELCTLAHISTAYSSAVAHFAELGWSGLEVDLPTPRGSTITRRMVCPDCGRSIKGQ